MLEALSSSMRTVADQECGFESQQKKNPQPRPSACFSVAWSLIARLTDMVEAIERIHGYRS
jgi:hypothetical protein